MTFEISFLPCFDFALDIVIMKVADAQPWIEWVVPRQFVVLATEGIF